MCCNCPQYASHILQESRSAVPCIYTECLEILLFGQQRPQFTNQFLWLTLALDLKKKRGTPLNTSHVPVQLSSSPLPHGEPHAWRTPAPHRFLARPLACCTQESSPAARPPADPHQHCKELYVGHKCGSVRLRVDGRKRMPCHCGAGEHASLLICAWDRAVDGALSRHRCQRKLQESPSLPLSSLALSIIQQSQRPESQGCVHVHLALNATGIRGLELNFLVLSSNRFGWLRILKRRKHQTYAGNLWQIEFDCFPAESGQKVFVSLDTIPPGVLSINQTIAVTSKQSGTHNESSPDR
ncbi:uncharacterized protein LOC134295878 [Anolis carolinensis]|uniref:uncharacterized protein LOC134295878 n=1 Tax=Anolis carolinensis TaxID=28377 RepID=UPI002F2B78FF